jgi:hypothetical protein
MLLIRKVYIHVEAEIPDTLRLFDFGTSDMEEAWSEPFRGLTRCKHNEFRFIRIQFQAVVDHPLLHVH